MPAWRYTITLRCCSSSTSVLRTFISMWQPTRLTTTTTTHTPHAARKHAHTSHSNLPTSCNHTRNESFTFNHCVLLRCSRLNKLGQQQRHGTATGRKRKHKIIYDTHEYACRNLQPHILIGIALPGALTTGLTLCGPAERVKKRNIRDWKSSILTHRVVGLFQLLPQINNITRLASSSCVLVTVHHPCLCDVKSCLEASRQPRCNSSTAHRTK